MYNKIYLFVSLCSVSCWDLLYIRRLYSVSMIRILRPTFYLLCTSALGRVYCRQKPIKLIAKFKKIRSFLYIIYFKISILLDFVNTDVLFSSLFFYY